MGTFLDCMDCTVDLRAIEPHLTPVRVASIDESLSVRKAQLCLELWQPPQDAQAQSQL